MSSAETAESSAAPSKSPKRKRARPQKKSTGPTLSDLILQAVSTSTQRGGMSLAALKKALMAGGYDVVRNNTRILAAVRRLVANKSLVKTKGIGASGSFKLNKKATVPRKKRVVKKTKAKTRKVKKTSAVKVANGDTAAAMMSPKKKRRVKSPKKARNAGAAKKAKKTSTSLKKTKKQATKSARTRAAAKK